MSPGILRAVGLGRLEHPPGWRAPAEVVRAEDQPPMPPPGPSKSDTWRSLQKLSAVAGGKRRLKRDVMLLYSEMTVPAQ